MNGYLRSILLLAAVCWQLLVAEESPIRYPELLPPHRQAAYAAVTAELRQNAAALHQTFVAGDTERERQLYTERHEILRRRRDLMPPMSGPPLVYEGIVDAKHGRRIGIQVAENRGVSLSVGSLSEPALRDQYAAIQIGDRIKLVFKKRPGLYDNDAYHYELVQVQRLGPGQQQVRIWQQSQSPKFEDTAVLVLHPRAEDPKVLLLASVRNNQGRAIEIGTDKQYFLSVRAGNDDVPYTLRHVPERIEPGAIGVFMLEVQKSDFTGNSLTLRAGTRTGSLLYAVIEIQRPPN